MKTFEQLDPNDQLEISINALRLMWEGHCRTLAQLVAKRGCTADELWREICEDRGYFDECEPWAGFPARGPPKESWNLANGAGDRPLPEHWERLLDHWRKTMPHIVSRQ